MVCCLLCFDDSPIDGDPRAGYGNQWQVGMMDAPGKSPGIFCYSFCCFCCAQYSLREKSLGGDWSKYKCCQGYYDFACFKAGSFGDEGNQCCMCVEACCCPGAAVSSTRALVMDSRNIIPDPCDNRIIRFNNCIQLISCICDIVACFVPEMRDIADLIDFIADIVFLTTAACMTAQTDYELEYEKQQNKQINWNYQPASRTWFKDPNAQGPSAPQGQQMSRPVVGMGMGGGGMAPVQPVPITNGMQPMAAPRMFQVVCPQGVGAGSQIIVTTPEQIQMGVQVPAGVGPGMVFQVNY